MTEQALETIVLCGHGLAFEASLAAFSQSLPRRINVIALELEPQLNKETNKDVFYGHVTSPAAYDFHLSMGLTEPDLIYNSDTSFAYGTHYQNWANHLNWIQAYNLPFPIWQSAPFHHYLLRMKRSLQPYLVGAVCGYHGRFAHPPSDPQISLSRAEYGYQLNPHSISALLKKQNRSVRGNGNVIRKTGVLKTVHRTKDEITSIELMDGQHVKGELYVDASGQAGHIIDVLGNNFHVERSLHVTHSSHKRSFGGHSLRTITGETYGWKSITTLRETYSCLTVAHPDQKDQADQAHESLDNAETFPIDIGRRPKGWLGNCVAIGHSSYILEPLTPAPLMLLHRDIERLLSLIPHGCEMALEMKEYNRLLENDIEHCDIFQRAFYETSQDPQTSYWEDIKSHKTSEKLDRKITQFMSRGFLVKFDLEPFNEEDWAILHFGMERKSQRYTQFTSSMSEQALIQNLNSLEKSIQLISQKVPPHDKYVENFVRYLEKKM